MGSWPASVYEPAEEAVAVLRYAPEDEHDLVHRFVLLPAFTRIVGGQDDRWRSDCERAGP